MVKYSDATAMLKAGGTSEVECMKRKNSRWTQCCPSCFWRRHLSRRWLGLVSIYSSIGLTKSHKDFKNWYQNYFWKYSKCLPWFYQEGQFEGSSTAKNVRQSHSEVDWEALLREMVRVEKASLAGLGHSGLLHGWGCYVQQSRSCHKDPEEKEDLAWVKWVEVVWRWHVLIPEIVHYQY